MNGGIHCFWNRLCQSHSRRMPKTRNEIRDIILIRSIVIILNDHITVTINCKELNQST